MIVRLAAVQADPVLMAQLERIAVSQVIMAVAMVLIVLMALAIAFGAWRAMRAVGHMMGELQKIAERLSIRAEPLIDSGRRVVDDVSDVSRRVRKQADEFAETLEELNRTLRHGTTEATRRVQEFGAVLDVVQSEAEDLLIGTTASARGLHTTAEALRGRRSPRRPGPSAPPPAPPPPVPPEPGE